MSTLTKILIVLLTVASIFLCGIVVTYVANADKYKELNKKTKLQLQVTGDSEKKAKKQLAENIAKSQQREMDLKNQTASLKRQNSELETKLKASDREKTQLLQQVNSWASITKDFYNTNDKQGLLLTNTLAQLKQVQAEQIKTRKQLEETTASLQEKMAIIETLETEKKRLLEAKAELQDRLDKILMPSGQTAARPTPVTPVKYTVKPATDVKNIALEGKITEVDLANSLAGISLGSADGVKEGMKFHVVRGDKFICDILILEVETDVSAGILELLDREKPKVGDKVSTNI